MRVILSERQSNPGKALFLPCQLLKFTLERGLYQEDSHHQRQLFTQEISCIFVTGQPLLSKNLLCLPVMAFLLFVAPVPNSFP